MDARKVVTGYGDRYSASDTVDEAIADWNKQGAEMVALGEPQEVVIRDYHDGVTRFFNAKQVQVKWRYSKRSPWAVGVLTFAKDRYAVEDGGVIYIQK